MHYMLSKKLFNIQIRTKKSQNILNTINSDKFLSSRNLIPINKKLFMMICTDVNNGSKVKLDTTQSLE